MKNESNNEQLDKKNKLCWIKTELQNE
jgi:hypothetical protein